mgnify:FL=1
MSGYEPKPRRKRPRKITVYDEDNDDDVIIEEETYTKNGRRAAAEPLLNK